MTKTLVDGVSYVASSAGTGDFVYGSARASFISLAQAVSNGTLVDGDTVAYLAVDNPITPTQREWGLGTFSATANSIARTTVLGGTAGPGTPVNFTVPPVVWTTFLQESMFLQNCNDTNIVSPSNGQALVFNSGSGFWENGSPAVALPGFIYGMELFPTSTTALEIARAGSCSDSTGTTTISLSSTFHKTTGGAWAAGNGSNGMGNGLTIANNTWYHVFAIINGGSPDMYYDTDPGAANAPAGTTAFRRIFSFKTGGSANILPFFQNEDEVTWNTPITEINASTITTTTTNTITTLNGCPPGVDTKGKFWLTAAYNTTPDTIYIVGGGITPQATSAPYGFKVNASGGPFSHYLELSTPQGQANGLGICSAAADATVTLVTAGYTDYRGRFGHP
jgi:hypothetical protein